MKVEIYSCDVSEGTGLINMRDVLQEWIEEDDAVKIHALHTTINQMPPDDDHRAPWMMMTVTVIYDEGPNAKPHPVYRVVEK